jgi:hypothetical protein
MRKIEKCLSIGLCLMEGMFTLSTVVVSDMEDIASGINFLHWYTGFFTIRIDHRTGSHSRKKTDKVVRLH